MFRSSFSLITLSLVVAVQGCGGGAGGPVDQRSGIDVRPFVGKYGFCENNELTTRLVTFVSEAEVAIKFTSDFYQNADCTGAVVASETPYEINTSFQRDMGSISVVNLQNTGNLFLRVYEVALLPKQRYSINLSGSGVYVDAQGRTCIRFSATSNRCYGADSYPDIIEVQRVVGYISFDNNIFYGIKIKNGAYDVFEAYPKI